METLIYSCQVELQGEMFEIHIFTRPDGRHTAKTVFSANDVLINDGQSLDEALERQQRLLPLALNSRRILTTKSKIAQ
ncbi:MAG: hypothetical protein C0621_06125 [Desulfuromonas sp.]|nr:MAG: hypothetical protein C0621_06125 [Desulfuromonas sp.]